MPSEDAEHERLFNNLEAHQGGLSLETQLTVDLYSMWASEHLTVKAWTKLRAALQKTGQDIGSLQAATQLVNSLTGLEVRRVDMCIDSCMAFTGEHASRDHCCAVRGKAVCGKPRFSEDGEPQRQFAWLPVLPRLRLDYERGIMPEYFEDSLRRANQRAESGEEIFRDFPDGSVCAAFEATPPPITEPVTKTEYFLLSLDGAQWRPGKTANGWLILATRQNLPPEIRFKEANTVLIAVIPGPLSPCDLDSFLLPIVDEITRSSVLTFDKRTGSHLQLCGRIAGVCGDQPASAKVSKMTGAVGVTGCCVWVTWIQRIGRGHLGEGGRACACSAFSPHRHIS